MQISPFLQAFFCLICGKCQALQPFWSPQWRIVAVKNIRMWYDVIPFQIPRQPQRRIWKTVEPPRNYLKYTNACTHLYDFKIQKQIRWFRKHIRQTAMMFIVYRDKAMTLYDHWSGFYPCGPFLKSRKIGWGKNKLWLNFLDSMATIW